jgi:hypothetical protein
MLNVIKHGISIQRHKIYKFQYIVIQMYIFVPKFDLKKGRNIDETYCHTIIWRININIIKVVLAVSSAIYYWMHFARQKNGWTDLMEPA